MSWITNHEWNCSTGNVVLIAGAQIVDGKLVLPQQYQYVTENGETVMLVYETPDGQQVMAENGEQIVFLVIISYQFWNLNCILFFFAWYSWLLAKTLNLLKLV